MSPETRLDLQRLLSALCDGELTEAQHVRLEELLADADCRRLYLEYVDFHARLLMHSPGGGLRLAESGSAAIPFPSPATIPSPPADPGRRPVRQVLRYSLVAAATLAASLLVQVFWWSRQEPPEKRDARSQQGTAEPREPPLAGYVATLTHLADCVWENPGEPWRVGSRLLSGELRLRKGVARLRFDSGPSLVVEGPAQLRLDSGTVATVVRGKVVFKADETVAPFRLQTPSSTLVDLGTEYAVVVGAEGEEIHVFDGEVQRTPRAGGGQAEPEHLTAGEARRYAGSSAAPGQPTALDPERFVRQLSDRGQPPPDPMAGLLAYEGFDYPEPRLLQAGKANSGFGWAGPWRAGFARPLLEGDRNRLALNVNEGLVRPGAAVPAVGGSFDYTGFAKYYRRLATPVCLDRDEVYYLSFLFRRHGPPADPLNAVAVQLRTSDELENELQKKGTDLRLRLNIGVDRSNHLFTHLQRVGTRTPLPLSYGETYLLVAKIVASGANPDQVFVRVYGPQEPVEPEESGNWSVAGPLVHTNLVFDWLEVHVNSKTRQTIDEVRLGTTWSSVAATWIGVAPDRKGGKP
jgi:hypothetical protein